MATTSARLGTEAGSQTPLPKPSVDSANMSITPSTMAPNAKTGDRGNAKAQGGLRINPRFRFCLERAIVVELLERFSDADVDGIILSESQALTIACAAV